MSPQLDHVVEKLEQLSPERSSEVEDFIDFLHLRDQVKWLQQDFARASEAAFAKAWEKNVIVLINSDSWCLILVGKR